jgi:hypothetical protein
MDLKKIINNIREANGIVIIDRGIPCFKETSKITHQWYNSENNKIIRYIDNDIDLKIKNYYDSRGEWLVTEKINVRGTFYDWAVWINGERSYINSLDTNYTGIKMLFNEANYLLFEKCRNEGVEYIIYDGIKFSCINPITFDDDWEKNYNHTYNKVVLQLKLCECFFNELFTPRTEFFNVLTSRLKKIYEFGIRNEKFYVGKINDFFPDITEIDHSFGYGDPEDRITGIDVWTTHGKNGVNKTHQVKGSKIFDVDGGYRLSCAFNHTSRCDYYAFVKFDKRIVVFNYDRTKVVSYSNGDVFFPNELLIKDIKY